jgi:hypothetical protein
MLGSTETVCGNCSLFRREDTQGDLVGSTIVTIEGEERIVFKGFCGALLGLVNGILHEAVLCRHRDIKGNLHFKLAQ